MLGSHERSVSTHEAGLTLVAPLYIKCWDILEHFHMCARVDQLPTVGDLGILK